MNIKKIMLLLVSILLFSNVLVSGSEKENSWFFIDHEPAVFCWISKGDGDWVLEARFERGVMKTYFKNAPPQSGLGISW